MRLTEHAHHYLSKQLNPGDHAIDATAGNGFDTTHMASLVGQEGLVIAIDIQEAAIEATRRRLKAQGCLLQVQLLTGEHSEILQSLSPEYEQSVSAIIFNLGYLPGSDKRVQTSAKTTLHALEISRKLLKPGGLLLVTTYRGHEGGQAEADSVIEWMQKIETLNWWVKRHDPAIKKNKIPPILFVARRPSTNRSETGYFDIHS